ncbi:MAG: Dabb family protein [Christensenellales bacterium]
MIKHVVMYQLQDSSEESKDALVARFMSMQGKIEVLKSIEAGKDCLGSERSFDVVLICTFDSLADMQVYKEHPVHVPVMQYVKSVVVKSHSVDFQY